MQNFLKATEVPQTKLRLKKALLDGSILLFENNSNRDNIYRKIDPTNVIDMWHGFIFSPKCIGENNEAAAYLGTSFYYKFAKA